MVRHKILSFVLFLTYALALLDLCESIVGGKVVNPPSIFPWVVSIRVARKHRCGGSLIAPNWILTAGHCGDDEEFNYSSRLNAPRHSFFRKSISIFVSGLQEEIRLSRVKIYHHENFSKITLFHDISLWHFSESISVDTWPILDTSKDSFSGWIGTALGWGSDCQFGKMSHNLHKVLLPILARNACTAALGQSLLGPGMICAGGLENQDTCKGDSGGPLIVLSSGCDSEHVKARLVGVVSWGLQCGVYGYPGIYTSVSGHLSWINQTIASNSNV